METSSRVFASNITTCIDKVREKAKELNLSVSITPAQLFKKKQLLTEQALVSGCSSSYDAWSLRRHTGFDLTKTNWRFASGDIHMSWPNPKDYGRYSRINVARFADLFFGCAEVAYTTPTERNKYYGIGGLHRPTPYGVEYKSVGNWWMVNEKRMRWAYTTALNAIGHGLTVDSSTLAGKDLAARMVNVRTHWDRTAARHIMDDFGVRHVPPANRPEEDSIEGIL